MAKKEISGYVKLQIKGGQANPAPPVGPALGQRGINIMEFCKAFNEKTKNFMGKPVPVIITIHGGPESQYRPRFSSSIQQWVKRLGAAVIAPNVRGSNGYGKDYLKMDNGYKREDSGIHGAKH